MLIFSVVHGSFSLTYTRICVFCRVCAAKLAFVVICCINASSKTVCSLLCSMWGSVCMVYKKLWVCSATYGAQIAISSSRRFRCSGLGRLWGNEQPLPPPPWTASVTKIRILNSWKMNFYVHTGSCNRIYEPLPISFSVYKYHIPSNV